MELNGEMIYPVLIYIYVHEDPEYILYYCPWKHGLLEFLLPIHNILCTVYVLYN